jgi:hypothetical protein
LPSWHRLNLSHCSALSHTNDRFLQKTTLLLASEQQFRKAFPDSKLNANQAYDAFAKYEKWRCSETYRPSKIFLTFSPAQRATMKAFAAANATNAGPMLGHDWARATARRFFKALDDNVEYADVSNSLESGEGKQFQVAFAFLVHVLAF